MEFTALENDKLKKKIKRKTNVDYSFPMPRYERLIACEIMWSFSAAVSIIMRVTQSQTIASTFRELDHKQVRR